MFTDVMHASLIAGKTNTWASTSCWALRLSVVTRNAAATAAPLALERVNLIVIEMILDVPHSSLLQGALDAEERTAFGTDKAVGLFHEQRPPAHLLTHLPQLLLLALNFLLRGPRLLPHQLLEAVLEGLLPAHCVR